MSKVWADGGYQNSIFNHGARLGIDVEVVQRPRIEGFEPLLKRWVLERTFGWLMQHRRLARDYGAPRYLLRGPARGPLASGPGMAVAPCRWDDLGGGVTGSEGCRRRR
ncbi:hypothetical protein ACFUTR_30430 [Streptomyces sp. NPDC057367]|uniref:hypothetical protein n=1 Tax=Streptomyces sp. NPDC057367 TaxID=3346108 RepID=UPI00362818FC